MVPYILVIFTQRYLNIALNTSNNWLSNKSAYLPDWFIRVYFFICHYFISYASWVTYVIIMGISRPLVHTFQITQQKGPEMLKSQIQLWMNECILALSDKTYPFVKFILLSWQFLLCRRESCRMPGKPCGSDDECCTDFCHEAGTCEMNLPDCRAVNSPCKTCDDCCSGYCYEFTTCKWPLVWQETLAIHQNVCFFSYRLVPSLSQIFPSRCGTLLFQFGDQLWQIVCQANELRFI